MSIYYPVSRILPDWNRCSEGEIKGSRKLPEILNLSFFFGPLSLSIIILIIISQVELHNKNKIVFTA